MSRWYVEKDGTGIEKSGTGIEKSGTGIEKSGTGIEKSGTGIEKSGTGIGKLVLTCIASALVFSSALSAAPYKPEGALQIVANGNSVAVSWIIDGSVFSGVSSVNGSYAVLDLAELSLASPSLGYVDTTGGGTGADVETTGGGTGSSKETTGGGTGSSIETTGGGTGSSKETTGGGTGSSIETTGGGTGSSIETTGGGTGSSIETTGGGTGHESYRVIDTPILLTTGGGTGTDAISITLPGGTGLSMEVNLGCNSASVSVLDASYAEVVTFENVPVIGATSFCTSSDFGSFGGYENYRMPSKLERDQY